MGPTSPHPSSTTASDIAKLPSGLHPAYRGSSPSTSMSAGDHDGREREQFRHECFAHGSAQGVDPPPRPGAFRTASAKRGAGPHHRPSHRAKMRMGSAKNVLWARPK